MRTTAFWVASLALLSAPLLITADAAPAPHAQRPHQQHRRYLVPVRRAASASPLLNESGSQASVVPDTAPAEKSPAPVAAEPSPSPKVAEPSPSPKVAEPEPEPSPAKASIPSVPEVISSAVNNLIDGLTGGSGSSGSPAAQVVEPTPSPKAAKSDAPDASPSVSEAPAVSSPPAQESKGLLDNPLVVGLNTILSNVISDVVPTPAPSVGAQSVGNSDANPSPSAQNASPTGAAVPTASDKPDGLVGGLAGGVASIASQAVGGVNSIASGAGDAVSSLVGTGGLPAVVPAATGAIEPVVSIVSQAIPSDPVPSVPVSLPLPTKTGASDPDALVNSVVSDVVPSATPLPNAVGGILTSALPDAVGGIVSSVVPSVVSAVPDAVGGIVSSAIPDAVGGIVSSALPDAVPSIVSQIPGAVGGIISDVVPSGTSIPDVVVPIQSVVSDLTNVVPVPTGAPTGVPDGVVPPISEIVPPVSQVLPPLSGGLPAVSEIVPPVAGVTPPVGLPSGVAPLPTNALGPQNSIPADPVPSVAPPALVPTGIAPPAVIPSEKPANAVPAVSEIPLASGNGAIPIKPTGTDDQTALLLPSVILVNPSPSASVVLANAPKVLQPPGGTPVKQPDETLIQIGFNKSLNYAFVSSNEKSAGQIFTYLPQGMSDGLGLLSDSVRMQSIQPYDTMKQMGFVTTLALLYIPTSHVNSLSILLHTPTSDIYADHSTNGVSSLMPFINPAIPLLAGQTMGDGTVVNAQSQPSSSPGAQNGASPFGPDSASNQPVRVQSAAIATPVALAGAAFATAMVFVARRYRQQRRTSTHRRASSLPNDPVWMSGGRSNSHASRESRGSGNSNGRSIRSAEISAPVMAQNSLGWN